ncbi:MAG: hypothetical protein IJG80_08640, partial [Selenomonadaceae bacterium]|nr:hypothetical protein [Selenomonadaceae bacterium]
REKNLTRRSKISARKKSHSTLKNFRAKKSSALDAQKFPRKKNRPRAANDLSKKFFSPSI